MKRYQNRLLWVIGKDVAWERGSEHPWTCDAIIDAWLLRQLVQLAAHAPAVSIKELVAELEKRNG
jgi:hypothetical protein